MDVFSPLGLSLAQHVLFSPSTVTALKEAVRVVDAQQAECVVLRPGVVGQSTMELALALGVPALGCDAVTATTLTSPSGCRDVLEHHGVPLLRHLRHVKNLVDALAVLIATHPEVGCCKSLND